MKSRVTLLGKLTALAIALCAAIAIVAVIYWQRPTKEIKIETQLAPVQTPTEQIEQTQAERWQRLEQDARRRRIDRGEQKGVAP